MSNNHFKKGELYSVITGIASTAVARRLQKNFRNAGLDITVEQWSILYQLWKEDCLSQQELCNRSFRDKPSITRLIDNIEKQGLVKRFADKNDRRVNLVCLTPLGKSLQQVTLDLANKTLNEALQGVPVSDIELTKQVLQKVYDNLTS